jgi:hypothetical protein
MSGTDADVIELQHASVPPTAESSPWTVLPAHAASDRLPRAQLTPVVRPLHESYRAMVRDLIARRMPPGVIHHEGQLWVTRANVRWALRWCASVMRADAQPMIDAVDAAARPRKEETSL